ncbi:M15 family metallopeptidase [Methylocella sp.]|uniref:M15 family metallopeptidase n=1 Tax=Methylocella sp. TaxID=1978226 RepID=UPI0037850F14
MRRLPTTDETDIEAARRAAAELGFVPLRDVAPQIVEDMRYAGRANFLGRPVPGYAAARCWLRREAAGALAAAAREAAAEGLTLVVYDGYRPQRATRAFVAWAQDPADVAMKAEHYPHLDKKDLFKLGYIARESQHSTGAAVDLAFLGLDFGSPFDLFDPVSGYGAEQIPPQAKQNRARLRALMERCGFAGLEQEWWHFSLRALEGAPPQDFEVV